MATKTKKRNRGSDRKNANANPNGGQTPMDKTAVVEEPQPCVRTQPPEDLTIEERVVRILNHGENIHPEQAMEALLELVESLPVLEDKTGAIVIAGREYRWIRFAGTKTPDTEYPAEIPDMQINPDASKELKARLLITTGKVQLEDAKGQALARIYWENAIQPSSNRADRRNALGMVMHLIAEEKPELPKVEGEEVTDSEFDAIIMKHRRALEVLERCVEPESFGKKSDMGAATLSILEEIEDPRELAVILGVVLDKAASPQIASEIKKLAERVLGHGHRSMPSGVTFMGPNGPLDEENAEELFGNLGSLFGGRRR